MAFVNYGPDGLGYGDLANGLIAGQMFTYAVPAQALLLSATTGGHPTLFNPAGSGVLFIPVSFRMSFVSGTTTIGGVVIGDTLNAGAAAATGAAIATATLVPGKAAVRNAGAQSRMQWSPTTNTFAAAPAVNAAAGLNLGAAAPTGTGTYEIKFDGTLGYYPGSAMSFCYTVTTSTSLWIMSLTGLEVPVPF